MMPFILESLESVVEEFAWRGAIVLAATFALSMLVRTRSAALRHLVWTGGFVGLFLITLLTGRGPAIEIPVVSQDRDPDRLESRAPGLSPSSTSSSERIPLSSLVPVATSSAPGTSEPEPLESAVDTRLIEASPGDSTSSVPWIPLLWLGGVVAWAIRFGVSSVRLHAVRARSVIAPCHWSKEIELPSHIGVCLASASSRPIMPMVSGLFRPVILLPSTATSWDPDKRHSVLRHEAAHILRRDLPVDLLSQLTVALHWFNPLAWLALRKARETRELACDDRVLATGCRPSDYAQHLLDIGTHHRNVRLGLTASMARTGPLEPRLRFILSKGVPRHRVSRTTWVLSLVIGGILVPITLTRFSSAEPEPKESEAARVLRATNASFVCAARPARSGAKGILALTDAVSGEELWEIPLDKPPGSPPVLWKDRVIVFTDDGVVQCFLARPGRLLWKHITDRADAFFLEGIFSARGTPYVMLSNLSGIQCRLDVDDGRRYAPPVYFDPEPAPEKSVPVPREFYAAYNLKDKPLQFVVDPQNLLPERVRMDAENRLQSYSLLNDRDLRVLVVDRTQIFPGDVNQLHTAWYGEGSMDVLAVFHYGVPSSFELAFERLSAVPAASLLWVDNPQALPSTQFIDFCQEITGRNRKRAEQPQHWATGGVGSERDANGWLPDPVDPAALVNWMDESFGLVTEASSAEGITIVEPGPFGPKIYRSRYLQNAAADADLWVTSSLGVNAHFSSVGNQPSEMMVIEGSTVDSAVVLTTIEAGSTEGSVELLVSPADGYELVFTSLRRKVKEILVGKGDSVTKGQALVQLDDREATLALQQASDELRAMETLFSGLTGNEAPKTARRIHQAVDEKRAALSTAAQRLTEHTIRAPRNGRVVDIRCKAGETLTGSKSPVIVLETGE